MGKCLRRTRSYLLKHLFPDPAQNIPLKGVEEFGALVGTESRVPRFRRTVTARRGRSTISCRRYWLLGDDIDPALRRPPSELFYSEGFYQ